MELWKLFWGFFVANVLGYGGGPATIPLIQNEVVNHYHWLDNFQFANLLALGNSLPGPITTNIASYVGYQAAGWPGVIVALTATIAPSAIVLIVLLRLLHHYRQSPSIKGMTVLIQPVIAVMMLLLTWQMGQAAVHNIGILQSAGIAAVALWAMTKGRIHPAFVILGAFIYGALVVSHTI